MRVEIKTCYPGGGYSWCGPYRSASDALENAARRLRGDATASCVEIYEDDILAVTITRDDLERWARGEHRNG